MPKNIVIAVLAAIIAIGGAFATLSQSSRTANIEVRVWESTTDAEANYISARPEGGSWRTLGTIPLGKGDATPYEETASGRYRYSDITLAVPLPASDAATPRPIASDNYPTVVTLQNDGDANFLRAVATITLARTMPADSIVLSVGHTEGVQLCSQLNPIADAVPSGLFCWRSVVRAADVTYMSIIKGDFVYRCEHLPSRSSGTESVWGCDFAN